jgi:type I restriction enzyme S subunit
LRDTQDHISEDAAASASPILPAKSLLVVIRGMILAREIPVAITEVPTAFNQDLKAVVPREGVDPEFLLYALLARRGALAKEIGTSAHGTRRIGTSSLERLELAVPPENEQQAIATALSVINAACEIQSSRAVQLRDLKTATMAKVFQEGLRGGSVRKTDAGQIPASWAVERLSDLACEPDGFVQTGPFGSQLHADDYVTEGFPIVNPTHMDGDFINHARIPRISAEDASRLDRHRLRVGDILFSRRGDVGRHAHISIQEAGWICGTGCLLVRPSTNKIDPLYLSYALSRTEAQDYLRGQAVGSIMPNINTKILSSVPVPVPPMDDQRVIGQTLHLIAEAVRQAEIKHRPLNALFTSTLQAVMTGQVRVKPLKATRGA